MRIDIITIFPEMFEGVFSRSIIKRAREKALVEIAVHQLRDWTDDRHKTVDERPYGGGPGMVMKPEPIFKAVEDLQKRFGEGEVCLLTPQGERFNQEMAQDLSGNKHLYLICGHYEGVDERVSEYLNAREISIGDYVLTGGEIPVMVLVDAVVRLIPGVLGDKDSPVEESFSEGLLEYPQYTRPEEVRGLKVPEILLSGNHKAIKKFRDEMRFKRTQKRRPELCIASKQSKKE
ncbi:MAG: tRNA (guanosine(37)-N1)-methyltransferase TrmD [Candidatus Omnitrophica bacterium]|nr:tRNA (guanosine(37)-N1)-methyltransferase TrmD [Candidatus Omnitrophota bacterium]